MKDKGMEQNTINNTSEISELKESWLVNFLEDELRGEDQQLFSQELNQNEDLQKDLAGLKSLKQMIKDLDTMDLQMDHSQPVAGVAAVHKKEVHFSEAEKLFNERVFEEKLVKKIETKYKEPRAKVAYRQAKKAVGFVAMYALVITALMAWPRSVKQEPSLVESWSHQESSSAIELISTTNSSEVYLDMMLREDQHITLSEVNFLIK
jgi:hypothetical protein